MDAVSFGETMLRLSPAEGIALEGAASLETHIAGTESNMMIALARLGWRTGWVSRMPANSLGRHIARCISGHGVDTSAIVWVPEEQEEKLGILFVEIGMAPRNTHVVYDRKHTAIANLQPDELPMDYLTGADTLFLTGITPALSEGCRQAWLRVAREAHKVKRRVVFDVNYRAKLWSPAQARACLETVLPFVDVFICGMRDAQTVFGMPDDPEAAAREFSTRYNLPLVVLTLGTDGSLAFDGTLRRAPIFPTEVVDRIGAGDAFAAGFLFGWREKDLDFGLLCGNASAALKQTYRGDTTWTTRRGLLELVNNPTFDTRVVSR